jgi:hypothetical protein
VLEQVVRELPDGEDVDEVEEELERGDDALLAGARETAILIEAILPQQVLPPADAHPRVATAAAPVRLESASTDADAGDRTRGRQLSGAKTAG